VRQFMIAIFAWLSGAQAPELEWIMPRGLARRD
jgi:hypothetical protein